MQFKPIQIEFKYFPDYLYAYVEGTEDSAEISLNYWSAVVAECRRIGLRKILVEENIEETASVSEVFDIAKELPAIIGPGIVIGFVDRQLDHDALNRFGELVASNRGLNVRVFNDIDEAERWLTAN